MDRAHDRVPPRSASLPRPNARDPWPERDLAILATLLLSGLGSAELLTIATLLGAGPTGAATRTDTTAIIMTEGFTRVGAQIDQLASRQQDLSRDVLRSIANLGEDQRAMLAIVDDHYAA